MLGNAIRTTNPVLTEQAFAPQGVQAMSIGDERPRTMTLQGTVNATIILLGITCAVGVFLWSFLQKNPNLAGPITLIGSLSGCLLGLVLYFKQSWAPFIAPIVAIGQGCLAGGASVIYSSWAAKEPIGANLGTGLVLQASILTVGIAGALLLAYKSRLIKVTQNFRLAVVAATGGIFFLAIASLLLSLVGIRIPYIWDNGPIGIAVCGFIVVVAAMNLVLDFDFIEKGAEHNLPKHMEWYAAFGLLVTLVWLYISILRLLAMLASRRD